MEPPSRRDPWSAPERPGNRLHPRGRAPAGRATGAVPESASAGPRATGRLAAGPVARESAVFEPAPPRVPALREDEVHVWAVPLLADEAALGRCRALLDDAERARADRFHLERHRRRFTVAHAALRELLAAELDALSGAGDGPGSRGGRAADPRSLALRHGARGKPRLAGQPGLEFNLSHSDELALVAVARGEPVGVDVERIGELRDIEAIARRFFAPPEVEDLLGLPASERRAAFFRCWTRKEAYVKAVGDGIALGLDRFGVSLRPGEPARLTAPPLDAARWTLYDLQVADGHAAALAIRGPFRRLRCWRRG